MTSTMLEPGAWSGLEPLRDDVRFRLLRSCRDVNEVEDLVQETLIRAAHFRSSLNDRASLRGWVMRIARTVLCDHVRRETRLRGVERAEEVLGSIESRESRLEAEDPSFCVRLGGRELDSSELSLLLGDVLSKLSPLERGLLEAYYLDGLGVGETAARVGLTAECAKMRLYRLRGRLKRELRHLSALRDTGARVEREVVA